MNVRSIVVVASLALAYALAYLWAYSNFLYEHFEYVGYDLFSRSRPFLLLSLAITLFPLVAYRGLRAVSSAFAVLIYLLLYVPIILTFALASPKLPSEIIQIQVTFLLGMMLLFYADSIIIRLPVKLYSQTDLMPAVLVVTILSTLYVLFVYRGSLQFPSFGDDLYEQRFANVHLGGGLVTRYVSSWLATVFVPLSLSFGLTSGRYRYVVAAIAACVVLYVGAANKLPILLPAVYFGFYVLLRARISAMLPLLTAALSVLVVALVGLSKLSNFGLVIGALVLHRTIGNGGQLTLAYEQYFDFHERTGYSHVNGLNLFTRQYPYGNLGLGQVVGEASWGPWMNANANFWATDGLAAAGLPGVLFASLLAALLFMAMNTATQRYDRLFGILCFLSFMTTLLNQSLFSSFWSGGALFLIIFFLFDRRAGAAPASSSRLIALSKRVRTSADGHVKPVSDARVDFTLRQ